MLARTLSLSFLCISATFACRAAPAPEPPEPPELHDLEWVAIFTCDASPGGDGPTLEQIARSTLGSVGRVEIEPAFSFVPGPCFGPDPFFDPPDRPTLFFLRIDGEVDEVELRERLEGEPLVSEGRMEYLLARTRGR